MCLCTAYICRNVELRTIMAAEHKRDGKRENSVTLLPPIWLSVRLLLSDIISKSGNPTHVYDANDWP